MKIKRSYWLIFFFLVIHNMIIAQQPRLVLPTGHTDYINSASFSPDGKFVLTVSNDGTAKLWAVQTGMLLMEYETKLQEAFFAGIMDSCKGMCGAFSLKGFSPDGSKFIMMSGIGTEVWSVKQGKVLFHLQYDEQHRITDLFFSKDGKTIVGRLLDKTYKTWSAENGSLLPGNDWKFKGTGGKEGLPIVQSNGEAKISQDYKIKIPGNKAFQLEVPGYIIRNAFYNSDSSMLAVSCENEGDDSIACFRIIDVGSGRISSFKFPDGDKAYFSHDSKNLFIVTNECAHGECRFPECSIWNVQDGEPIATLKGHIPFLRNLPAFSPDGKKIVTINDYDSAIKIWNNEQACLLQPMNYKTAMNNVPFSRDSRKIILVDPGSLALGIVDIENNKLLKEIRQEKSIETLFERINERPIEKEDTLEKNWREQVRDYFGNMVGDQIRYALWGPGDSSILTSSFYPVSSMDAFIQLWNTKTGKLIRSYPYDDSFDLVLNENGQFFLNTSADDKNRSMVLSNAKTGKIIPTFKGSPLSISPDGNKLITAGEKGIVYIWSIANRRLLYQLRGNDYNNNPVFQAKFSPDGKRMATISMDSTLKLWDVVSGKLVSSVKNKYTYFINVFFNPAGKEMMSFDDSTKIWSATDGTFITKLNTSFTNFWDPAYSADGKLIITTSIDHSVNIWDAFTHELQYSFLQVDSTDYMYLLPSGYYKATGSAARQLHYVTEDLGTMAFEQLDVKYNRPDKVLQATGCKDQKLIDSYRKAYYKRLQKLGIDSTTFSDGYSLPVSELLNRDTIRDIQQSGYMTLRIAAKDSISKLDRFNTWINEVPLFGMRGINLRSQGKNNFDTSITIQLSQGDNRIETSVTNVNGIESYRKPLLVKYSDPLKEAGKIYFIGVGINHFADSTHDLKWCVQDIKDLTATMRSKYGNRLVIVDTLYDEKATRTNIRNLKKKLMNTTVNDKVIFSYSGHGLLSQDYDYYISSYTINFSNPEEGGIPYDEIENMLDSIPARKKILLLDACNSGEVDKEEMKKIEAASSGLSQNHTTMNASSRGVVVTNTDSTARVGLQNSFDLMQSLFVNVGKGTGAIIISASGGVQFAQERSELGHGVFTYSVIEAMKKYPSIKISAFRKYIYDRVMNLTNGLQKPTTRSEPIAVDWEF